MAALFILSVDKRVGKTAFATGLGKRLEGAGKKVAYLRPSIDADTNDAVFVKQALALPDSVETMSVAVAPAQALDQIKAAYNSVSQGRDVVIVEGTLDSQLGQVYSRMAGSVNGKVILVEAYSSSHPESYQAFGPNLIGVIVNKVPKSRVKTVREAESSRLTAAGVALLGTIPEDRALLSVSVGEMAASLQGKVLNSDERTSPLIENIMLGAMSVDSGLVYYGRRARKAAVLRADRPDMQLAALETDTCCLVLSGSRSAPIHSVAFKAEDRRIPVIASEKGTNEIIAGIENALANSRFDSTEKLARFSELMQQGLDLSTIYKGLGVAG